MAGFDNNRVPITLGNLESQYYLSPQDQLIEVTDRHQVTTAPNAMDVVLYHGMIMRAAYTITHACSGLVLEFGNQLGYLSGSGFNQSTGAFGVDLGCTIAGVAVEDKNGLIYPVTFGGERTADMSADSIVRADFLPLMCVPGDTVYIRTALGNDAEGSAYVPCMEFDSTRDKNLWMFAHTNPNYNALELVDLPVTTHPWDAAYSNGLDAMANNDNGTRVKTGLIAPSAVLGVPINKTKPYILFIGDSILTKRGADNHNWISKHCETHGIPYTICSRNGEKAQTAWTWNKRIATYVNDADIIVSCMGRNDALYNANATTQLNNFKTRMLAWWANFPAGKRIYQTTISPFTNAANGDSATGTPSVAGIKAMNDWIRTIPAPLTGVIEFADMTMTTRDSGVWKSLSGVAYADTEGTAPNDYKIHPSHAVGIPELQLQTETTCRAILGIDEKPSAYCLDVRPFVVLGANTTPVGTSVNIPVPKGVLRGIVIEAGIPGGWAGGDKTVQYSVGTTAVAANENNLGDVGTDIDVMTATTANSAATSKTALEAGFLNLYVSAPTNYWFNMVGSQADTNKSAGTCAMAVKIWVFVDRLP